MKTEVNVTHKTQWQEVIPHREDVFFEGFELFREYLVVEERKHGLIHLRILHGSEGQGHELDFGEPAIIMKLTRHI
jgi:oligopeptidase B